MQPVHRPPPLSKNQREGGLREGGACTQAITTMGVGLKKPLQSFA